MECQYCKNTFSTKTSLNTHQKTAKYCILLRGEHIPILYTCIGCSKNFPRKYEYQRHIAICDADVVVSEYKSQLSDIQTENNKKQILICNLEQTIQEQKNLIQEQKQTIKDLQDKLENIALKSVSHSTTTKNTQINNYIQNLQPVTDEYLLDNVKHLSIDHILRGPEGYADYALEYPLKNSLICVDYSRRKVKFKDKDGNVITDPEMNNLATKFFNSIKDKNKDLIVEYGEKLKENFGDELDTIVKIFDYKSAIDNGSSGNKTEFQHDFVKHMCCKTIKEE